MKAFNPFTAADKSAAAEWDKLLTPNSLSADEYEARVSAIESEGVCRSDAQGIVDAQLLKEATA